MNEIVDKLSEIELIANKIMEDTNARKKELALIMEKKTKDFDIEIENNTMNQIRELKEQLNNQIEQDLNRLRKINEDELKRLETKYSKNHTDIAKNLLNQVLGV